MKTTGAGAAINEEIYGRLVVCCHLRNDSSATGRPSIMQNLPLLMRTTLKTLRFGLAGATSRAKLWQ